MGSTSQNTSLTLPDFVQKIRQIADGYKKLGEINAKYKNLPAQVTVLAPLGDAEIQSLETKFGHQFPAEIKKFLKLSKGLHIPKDHCGFNLGFNNDPKSTGFADLVKKHWATDLTDEGIAHVNSHFHWIGYWESGDRCTDYLIYDQKGSFALVRYALGRPDYKVEAYDAEDLAEMDAFSESKSMAEFLPERLVEYSELAAELLSLYEERARE